MAFPRRLLVPGEELVLDLRPHWIALALPALATAGIVIVGFWLVSKANATLDKVILAAMAILLIVYPLRRLVWWLTSYFVVTSDRLIHREGWIAKHSMEIPLEAINDVRFAQGIFERIIGADPNGEVCACQLTGPLGLSQPTVSHHLRVLTDAGLIGREQRGRWAYFWVLPEPLDLLRGALTAPPRISA